MQHLIIRIYQDKRSVMDVF